MQTPQDVYGWLVTNVAIPGIEIYAKTFLSYGITGKLFSEKVDRTFLVSYLDVAPADADVIMETLKNEVPPYPEEEEKQHFDTSKAREWDAKMVASWLMATVNLPQIGGPILEHGIDGIGLLEEVDQGFLGNHAGLHGVNIGRVLDAITKLRAEVGPKPAFVYVKSTPEEKEIRKIKLKEVEKWDWEEVGEWASNLCPAMEKHANIASHRLSGSLILRTVDRPYIQQMGMPPHLSSLLHRKMCELRRSCGLTEHGLEIRF